MFDLNQIQAALREFELPGWLLYDFRGNNLLARRVLKLKDRPPGSRRFFYCIPAVGEPRKLVHRIESEALDHLPGEKHLYLRWQALEAGVGELVSGLQRVAMEFSPRNANPYISRVDGGTVDLVRSFGVDVVPSGDLVQMFEATWDEAQWQMHLEAAVHTDSAFSKAWRYIADQIRTRGSVSERDVQRLILQHFAEHKLTTYSPPIVAAGSHSGNPHYETGDTEMREGDEVLIDLWAKLDQPRGVYSDLTRVGYIGKEVPARYEEIFQIVARARDTAVAAIKEAFATQTPLQGFQVDQVARNVIEAAGYGAAFVHRTGHSIGQEIHGNGANMDNLETHDMRRILRRTCFSIEPGIYLPEFGIRSEVNVFIDAAGQVHVTGLPLQTRIVPILAEY